MNTIGFLDHPEVTGEGQRLFDDDIDEVGYVMNVSRLWAYRPEAIAGLFDIIRDTVRIHQLGVRERGVIVAACASTFGDSYCSLSWGSKLAAASDAQIASGVIRGDDTELSDRERALAAWARKVARDPVHTTQTDVQELRAAGYTDAQIFAITVFIAMRIAFSTVNNALGAQPDAQFLSTAPEAVLRAVTYGRPVDDLKA